MFNPNYYQPYYGRPQPPQQPAPIPAFMQQPNGILWVGSENEAYNYMMAPNTAAALWDSSRPTIYLKQTDAAGRPSIKTYDLVERSEPLASPSALVQAPAAEYVTRREFEELAARIEAMNAKEDISE